MNQDDARNFHMHSLPLTTLVSCRRSSVRALGILDLQGGNAGAGDGHSSENYYHFVLYNQMKLVEKSMETLMERAFGNMEYLLH